MRRIPLYLLAIVLYVALMGGNAFAVSEAQELYLKAKKEPFMFKRLALYEEAIGKNENFLEARKEKAIILYYQGKHEEAIEELNFCIARGMTLGEIYRLRAKAYMALGEYRKALDDYTQVLIDTPGDRPALLNRALAHYHLKNYNAAVEDIKSILKDSSYDDIARQAYRLIGSILMIQGESESARANFAKAGGTDGLGFGINYYSSIYSAKAMSVIGMIGLIVSCLALIFRADIPAPRRKNKRKDP